MIDKDIKNILVNDHIKCGNKKRIRALSLAWFVVKGLEVLAAVIGLYGLMLLFGMICG